VEAYTKKLYDLYDKGKSLRYIGELESISHEHVRRILKPTGCLRVKKNLSIELIIKTFKSTGGNYSQAADKLDVNHSYIHKVINNNLSNKEIDLIQDKETKPIIRERVIVRRRV
jgi:hypothetical protein